MFMLYDGKLKGAMLSVLQDRILSIASCINDLNENGYTPNKKKITILSWATILTHAYENVDVFSKQQQQNLDIVYNKVIKL